MGCSATCRRPTWARIQSLALRLERSRRSTGASASASAGIAHRHSFARTGDASSSLSLASPRNRYTCFVFNACCMLRFPDEPCGCLLKSQHVFTGPVPDTVALILHHAKAVVSRLLADPSSTPVVCAHAAHDIRLVFSFHGEMLLLDLPASGSLPPYPLTDIDLWISS